MFPSWHPARKLRSVSHPAPDPQPQPASVPMSPIRAVSLPPQDPPRNANHPIEEPESEIPWWEAEGTHPPWESSPEPTLSETEGWYEGFYDEDDYQEWVMYLLWLEEKKLDTWHWRILGWFDEADRADQALYPPPGREALLELIHEGDDTWPDEVWDDEPEYWDSVDFRPRFRLFRKHECNWRRSPCLYCWNSRSMLSFAWARFKKEDAVVWECFQTARKQEWLVEFEELVGEMEELARAGDEEEVDPDYTAWLDKRHEWDLGRLKGVLGESRFYEDDDSGIKCDTYWDRYYDEIAELEAFSRSCRPLEVEAMEAEEFGRMVRAVEDVFLTFSDVDDASSSDGEGDRLTQEVLAIVNEQLAREEVEGGKGTDSELSSVPSDVELTEVEGVPDDNDDDSDDDDGSDSSSQPDSSSQLAPSEIGDSMPVMSGNVTVFRRFGIRASSAVPQHAPTSSVASAHGSPPISRPSSPKPLTRSPKALSVSPVSGASAHAENNSSPEPPISPSLSLCQVSDADQAFIDVPPRTPARRAKLVVPDTYAEEEGLFTSESEKGASDSDYEGDHEGARERTEAARKTATQAGWRDRSAEDFSDPEEAQWSPTVRWIAGRACFGQDRPPTKQMEAQRRRRQLCRTVPGTHSASAAAVEPARSPAGFRLGSEVSTIPATPQERPVRGLLSSPTPSDLVTHVSESTTTSTKPRVVPPGRVQFTVPDGQNDPSNPFYYPSPCRPKWARRPQSVRSALRRREEPQRPTEEESEEEEAQRLPPPPPKRRRRNMDSDSPDSEDNSEEEPQAAQAQDPPFVESDPSGAELPSSTPIHARYDVTQPVSVLAIAASKEQKKARQDWRDENPASSAHPRLQLFLSSSKIGASKPPPVPPAHTRPLPPPPPSPGFLPFSPTPLRFSVNLPQPRAPPPSPYPTGKATVLQQRVSQPPTGKATVLQQCLPVSQSPTGKAPILQQGSPVSQPHWSSCRPTPTPPQRLAIPRRRAYGQPVATFDPARTPEGHGDRSGIIRTPGDELKYAEWVAEGFVNADERDSSGSAPSVRDRRFGSYNKLSDFPRGCTHDYLGMRVASSPAYPACTAPEALSLLGLDGPVAGPIQAAFRFEIKAQLWARGFPKKWEADSNNRTMTKGWEEAVMAMTRFPLLPRAVLEALNNGPQDQDGALWMQKRRCYVACIDVIAQTVFKSHQKSAGHCQNAKRECEATAGPDSLWYTGGTQANWWTAYLGANGV